MSGLTDHVASYLRLRRALGFKLEREGQLLSQLVSYLEAVGAAALTSELAIAWAREPADAQPNHLAKRLGVVRKFAAYINGYAANLHERNFGWKACRILFITNTPERAANMREALNSLTKATNVRRLFFFTTADALSSADLFSHTWIDGNGQTVTLI